MREGKVAVFRRSSNRQLSLIGLAVCCLLFSTVAGALAAGSMSGGSAAAARSSSEFVNRTESQPTTGPAVVIGGIDVDVPLGIEINGTITGAGSPLPGATVTACDQSEICPRYTTTAADGTYTVTGLAPGEYFLEVQPAEESDAFEGWYTSGGPVDEFVDAEAVDASAGNVSGIDLDLDVGHHISGTVLGSGTVALQGVQVVAQGAAGSGGAVTDGSGAFAVHALADGSYTLDIEVPKTLNFVSGEVVDGDVLPPSGDGTPVEVAGANVTGIAIEPEPGLRMSGTLSGPGASNATVLAIGSENAGQATLAPNGHWEIAGLRPDGYQLLFEPATDDGIESLFPLGWWSGGGLLTANEAAATTVVVSTGDRTGLNATVPDGATLSGTVVADDGSILDEAYVYACADGAGCVSVLTNGAGAWAFDHAKPGGYLVQAWHASHVGGYFGPGGFAVSETLATTVNVGSADRPGVNFVLPTGASIAGAVSDPSTAPVAGASVQAFGNDGLPPVAPGRDTSAADGSFVLPGLDPDDYVVGFQFEPDSPYVDGFYAAGADGNFTSDFNDATTVVVDVQGDGSSYVPITPVRVADSRDPKGLGGVLLANVPQTFPVEGEEGIPADVVAVTGNVTVVGQTSAGYVAITPNPTASPSSSTLNVPVGDVRANNFTSPVADDGSLAVVYKAAAGKKSHVIVDITGYFLEGEGEATFNTIVPLRVMDTRPVGHVGSVTTLAANVPQTLSVAGTGDIPSDAVAITGNLTVVGQTSAGFLALTPNPTSTPSTSTLNFPLGDTRANGVSVPLNASGDLSIVFKGAGGTANAALDVTGYYLDDGSGLLFYALPPGRIMDTRPGVLASGLTGSFSSSSPRKLNTTGRAGVPLGASAVTGNLTVVGQTAPGFVAITTTSVSSPTTSTLNFPSGDIRANGVTVPMGSAGELWLVYKASSGKKTHLTLDLTGYFQ
jgi:hypothetical protein